MRVLFSSAPDRVRKVTYTLRPLYPQGNSSRCLLNAKLSKRQCKYENTGEDKIILLIPGIRPILYRKCVYNSAANLQTALCTIDVLFCILSGHEGCRSLSFEAGIVRYVTCMTNRKHVHRYGRHTSKTKAHIHVHFPVVVSSIIWTLWDMIIVLMTMPNGDVHK